MPTPILQDTMVDVNATLLTAHAPQFPVGASNWTTPNNSFAILNNKATAQSGQTSAANIYNLGATLTNFQADWDLVLNDTAALIQVTVNASSVNPLIGVLASFKCTSQGTFEINDGTKNKQVGSDIVTASPNTHHATVVFDGSTASYFFDGVLVQQLSRGTLVGLSGMNTYCYIISGGTSSAGTGLVSLSNLRITTLPVGVQAMPPTYWPGPLG